MGKAKYRSVANGFSCEDPSHGYFNGNTVRHMIRIDKRRMQDGAGVVLPDPKDAVRHNQGVFDQHVRIQKDRSHSGIRCRPPLHDRMTDRYGVTAVRHAAADATTVIAFDLQPNQIDGIIAYMEAIA